MENYCRTNTTSLASACTRGVRNIFIFYVDPIIYIFLETRKHCSENLLFAKPLFVKKTQQYLPLIVVFCWLVLGLLHLHTIKDRFFLYTSKDNIKYLFQCFSSVWTISMAFSCWYCICQPSAVKRLFHFRQVIRSAWLFPKTWNNVTESSRESRSMIKLPK